MKRADKIREFLETIEVDNLDINYCVDADKVNSFNDVLQCIEDNDGFYVEIIYYGSAMDYLKVHDPSLRESLELAYDIGITADNLSSETLASLLASKECREDFMLCEDEITEFFEMINNQEDEVLV